MKAAAPDGPKKPATRGQSTAAIKLGLRDVSLRLSLLNRQAGTRLGLRDVDLDCLDLINAHGPLGPSALARLAGVHPATLTGILDRLENAGWVARERDPADRRGTLVRPLRDRTAELLELFAGMTASVEEICAGYQPADLEVLADFLRRTAEAGRRASTELAGD
ncbi:MarR family winged helix-turn-helix transcriptional regulator [Embleya scabrispora]|uniref:MarR family winged helix-turn-helix transcriptional regulator n=1 Tax=Embleya scabrispora TaxID=159449 RepID=UPI0003804C90|nr:MarR family transcriptional regulator [Embleya scabrispora]MYS84631.1 MarR family transcriptional regulator [Streptomyces sp. SID5474]